MQKVSKILVVRFSSIGDIVLTSGGKQFFEEYFIIGITDQNIKRIGLHYEISHPLNTINFRTKDRHLSYFNTNTFDFIIIDEEKLSEKSKYSMEELRKYNWFRNDYM